MSSCYVRHARLYILKNILSCAVVAFVLSPNQTPDQDIATVKQLAGLSGSGVEINTVVRQLFYMMGAPMLSVCLPS